MSGAQTHLLGYVVGILVAALLGGALPFVRPWRPVHLHLFVAFGAGVLLGAFFLHLLPEIVHAGAPASASGYVLVGFLLVLVVERVVFRQHAHSCPEGCPHRHEILGVSSFIGLSVHSITAGLSLGVTLVEPALGPVVFFAILAHKATAAFSLATVFRLSDVRPRTAVLLLGLFALMTPLGALLAIPLFDLLKRVSLVIPTAIAAGTFLYVATMDLLPEAFHEGGRRLAPFVGVIAGVVVMLLVARLGA